MQTHTCKMYVFARQSGDIIGQLINAYCDKLDCVIYPARKKLVCLAMNSLLGCSQPAILQKFPGI